MQGAASNHMQFESIKPQTVVYDAALPLLHRASPPS